MLLKNIIFPLFGPVDKARDLNKDVNGKGTLERFVEMLGEDYDENIAPLLDNLTENTLVPQTALTRMLPYMEHMVGMPEIMSGNETVRRRFLRYWTRINEVRGTVLSYELCFKIMGFDSVSLVYYPATFGFDSVETFDSPARHFDSNCAFCSEYSVYVYTTEPLTDVIHRAIFNAIAYCQPINAVLRSVYYNDVILIGDDTISIWVDQNGDLVYEDAGSPGTIVQLSSIGDLLISGDRASGYTITDEGDIIFNY